jgi:hypothetical protein
MSTIVNATSSATARWRPPTFPSSSPTRLSPTTEEVFVWDVPPPPGGTWSADEARYRIEAFFERVIFSSRKNLAETWPYSPTTEGQCNPGIGDRYLVRLHGAPTAVLPGSSTTAGTSR